MRFTKLVAGCALALALSLSYASNASAEVGWRGWGPRFGLSDNPDQVIGGVQFDLGELAKHVRMQPSVEVGFGDEKVSLFGNFMVSYYFPVDANVTPYAGAEVTGWLFDNDHEHDPDFDDGFNSEIALDAVGGIETKLKSGTRFLGELQVGVDNGPDFRVVVGWIFK